MLDIRELHNIDAQSCSVHQLPVLHMKITTGAVATHLR